MKTKIVRRCALQSLLALAAWGSICIPAWAQGRDVLAGARASGVIRIANTQTSPPWSFIGDNNLPAGYDVEMAKELAKRIGIPKVVFVADFGKNFIEGLKADKYDLVMNDVTPTVERAKQVDFGAPYGVEDFRIFVRAANSDIKDQPDLKGKRIGVTTGSSNESWSREHLKSSEIIAYDNGGLVMNDLAIGRIDATIISHFGGLNYASANKLPIKEVGPPLTYQLSAPAMAKKQPALLAAVNKAISEMMADGTVDRLSRRWVGVSYDMSTAVAAAQKAQ